ncbi:MAG: hypothetical protein LVQ95_05605 [Candidatus Micrarchaeales archaeon]|nr:hypothetical protein [Candidatus Micrarchaeales archaeon]
MNFYDIAADSCTFDSAFEKRLGFKRIFVVNRDIAAVGRGDENKQITERSIAFGKAEEQLLALVKNGASAVAITDSYIDRKLMESIRENKCVLCLPMSIITASYGVERARNVYRMRKLFADARKRGIDVCFASMAKTPAYLNSYMQLIELAKLVGAEERYARYSMSEITKSLVEG